MSKWLYVVIGCVAGVLIGFISSTIYFRPLLGSKKNGLESILRSTVSTGFVDKVNDAAIKDSNAASKSMDYDSATKMIGTELAISLESMKTSGQKSTVHLTIAMLGARLSKSNCDTSGAGLFEKSATKICRSLAYMECCELDELYAFIRMYSGRSQC